MRVQTMAWFYGASGQLIHMGYLQFDHKTPNRLPGPNFGATDIDRFTYELKREKRIYEETIIIDSKDHGYHEFKVPHAEDVVKGTVTIGMNVNYFITELLAYLTRGQALSKIVVRKDKINESGRSIPFMQYTYKDCWLFEHETKAEFDAPQTLDIKFTYCCAEIHCFDGNRFATHERCIPSEPEENIQYQENYAHTDAIKQQAAIEAKRLAPTPVVQNDGAPVIHRFDVRAASEFNGKTIGPGELDDINFHIVERIESVDDLIDYLYDSPTEATRTHFKKVNLHLTTSVYPGQLVLLTPVDSNMPPHESGFWGRELEKINTMTHGTIAEGKSFSEKFVEYGNLAGMSANSVSFGTTYFQTQIRGIQQVVKELEEGYSKHLRYGPGRISLDQFRELRKKKFRELDALMTKAMKGKLYGSLEGQKMTHKLKLNPATIEHEWRMVNSRKLPTLSGFYQNIKKFEKVAKGASHIAIPLAAMETHSKIEKACLEGEEACTKAQYMEWMGFAGGLAGASAAGVFLTAITLPTAGGLLMVGLVAGAVFGMAYGASQVGTLSGKYVGNILYQRKIKKEPSVTIELMGD